MKAASFHPGNLPFKISCLNICKVEASLTFTPTSFTNSHSVPSDSGQLLGLESQLVQA